MRSAEQVIKHYNLERALADRLRSASKEERKQLYTTLYNELYRQVPDLIRDARSSAIETERRFRLISRMLKPDTTYLEIGPGDCALARRVATKVAHVYAVDVCDEIATGQDLPANFSLFISDGSSVPVQENTVDLAYSNQLLEHLHGDDVPEQLGGVFNALKSGGRYVCITPNALCGPHDISAGFDRHPTGFHLREYTNEMLIELFRKHGFRRFKCLLSYKSFVIPITLPIYPFVFFEKVLWRLPRKIARPLAWSLIAVKFVAIK